MGFLKPFIIGFVVKIAASFDDTLTRIPVIASFTKTRRGKVAFSLGTIFSLTAALALALFFTELIDGLSGARMIIAGLLLLLAVVVYLDIFARRTEKKVKEKTRQLERISNQRFFRLMAIGFVVSFLTVLDDVIVMTSIFLNTDIQTKAYISFGIYLATILQVMVTIYFAERISSFRYKKELASAALVILAVLVAANII